MIDGLVMVPTGTTDSMEITDFDSRFCQDDACDDFDYFAVGKWSSPTATDLNIFVVHVPTDTIAEVRQTMSLPLSTSLVPRISVGQDAYLVHIPDAETHYFYSIRDD